MNSVHDLGGVDGFGPIDAPRDEPIFSHDWERRVLGLFLPTSLVMGATIPEFRHAIERMDPVEYLSTSYYEHWLHAFETLLVEKGVLSAEELASGHAASGEKGEPPLRSDAVPIVTSHGHSDRLAHDLAPRFQAGDAVRARNLHPHGHTRLPRYIRGRPGRIDRDHGVFVFSDAQAAGQGEVPKHCYSVRFEARDLWGDDAEASAVYIDLFDDYLEAF